MKALFDENQILNMMELMQVRGGDGEGSGEYGGGGEDIPTPPPGLE